MAQPALDISHLRYRHGDGRQLELAVSLKVMPGQAVAITGPTGSGKTTFLRALAGNPPEGATVAWDAAILPERPALFLQDPEAQLLCSRVEEEVELGPRNQGLTGQPLAQRIDDALEALGINALRDCDIQTLSMGQKHRVALSALLAMRPSVLLLDEPFSQLDASGEVRLRALLTALKAKGHAIGITAHTVAPADPLWDIRLELTSNDCCNLQPCGPLHATPAPPPSKGAYPVLQAQGLGVVRESGRMVFEAVNLALERGTTLELRGDNATGKSTLLRCLAGLMTPQAGQVALEGKPLPHRSRLAGRLGYLPQNADMLLFEESVRREVGFTLRRLATPVTKQEALLEEMLRFCGLQRMASRAPLSLSHGERHMLAVASVLAARPSIILLDEPLTGLDARIGTALLHLLTYCARQHEMAVLLVTHGKLPTTWGDRCLVLKGGRLRDAA